MEHKTKTIEAMTADTILQRVQSIRIGGVEYVVAPPTLATLILISEEVSYLPEVEFNEATALTDALREARNYRALADIAAILILGAKRLVVEEERVTRFMWLFKRRRKVVVDMKARVAEALMNVEISELSSAVATMLAMMQTDHFFALATFLTGINLTKPTKVAKTTASGR